MSRILPILVVLLPGWSCAATATAGQGAGCDLPRDRVELTDGRTYDGMIESEDDVWIRLVQLEPADKPTHVVIRSIDRAQVAAVARLDPAKRDALREAIDRFRNHPYVEAGQIKNIRLADVDRDGTRYRRYQGNWFTLESSVDEAITRRMIVRMEQIFAAFRQILPPRTEPQRSPRIVVIGSMEEYQAYLGRLGLAISNPACFLEEHNLIVAGSNLAPFAAELAKTKDEHDRLRKQLEEWEAGLTARLAQKAKEGRESGMTQEQIQKTLQMLRAGDQRKIDELRQKLDVVDRANQRRFDEATKRMFPRLYHEAFHAYLENYVYPHEKCDVPRWLNEGLAVMFEGGYLRGSTLRVDAPSREALAQLKADLAGPNPLSIKELLEADPRAFVSHDHGGVAASNRHYFYSWGVAYSLTFSMHLLGKPALDRYVELPEKDVAPVERFERLVGMPIARFQERWRREIASLRCP